MGRIADIANRRFGRLTAVRFAGDGKWFCRCECGGSVTVITSNLTRGNTTSCGCAFREAHFKHGMGRTALYHAWVAMRARCNNPNDAAFANYGGRGIKVCERWNEFSNFLADMGARPKGYQIDRIDNEGDYEPGNCRWVSPKANLNNKRSSHFLTWKGETLTITQWAERLGIHQRTLFNRIGRGWSMDRAMTAPTQIRRK